MMVAPLRRTFKPPITSYLNVHRPQGGTNPRPRHLAYAQSPVISKVKYITS